MVVLGCIEFHPKGYAWWIEGFINYALFNPKNISGDGIRCPCKRCINKKFIDLDVMKHLRKKVHGKTLMLVCT
jgi:hypothetical protein